jgi:hypothetical protein
MQFYKLLNADDADVPTRMTADLLIKFLSVFISVSLANQRHQRSILSVLRILNADDADVPTRMTADFFIRFNQRFACESVSSAFQSDPFKMF